MNSTRQRFYGRVRELLEKENLFQTWFSDTDVDLIEDHGPVLRVPNHFNKGWINSNYRKELNQASREVFDADMTVEVSKETFANVEISSNDIFHESEIIPISNKSKPFVPPKKEYSLDTFIAGDENQLALAAAKAFRPNAHHLPLLVLCGDHGSGKTHLAYAIAAKWQSSEVCHLYAEEFANQYISAARSNTTEEFRSVIRSKKLFILEDVDFFKDGTKKKTMDELVNTLKVLIRDHKHIIITAHLPVSAFEQAHMQFATLMLSGLRIKLMPPSPSSRETLLNNCSLTSKTEFTPPVKKFLSQVPFRSIGELRDAIKQLETFSSFNEQALPLNVVKDLLSDHYRKDLSPTQSGVVDIHEIASIVGKEFGVSVPKLVSSGRQRYVATARHAAMAIAHDAAHSTLQEIGRFFGGRSHQSVLFALNKINQKVEADPAFRLLFRKLKDQVASLTEDSEGADG
ncbi:MAG: ATP-binding protein [Planctomycetes bacterium]|nr:ATP-binding protein [Planctomycetota bacterium]